MTPQARIERLIDQIAPPQEGALIPTSSGLTTESLKAGILPPKEHLFKPRERVIERFSNNKNPTSADWIRAFAAAGGLPDCASWLKTREQTAGLI